MQLLRKHGIDGLYSGCICDDHPHMKLSHFVTLVFLAASLIVVGVYTTGVQDLATVEHSIGEDDQTPMHAFVARTGDVEPRIDCPLIKLDDPADIWERTIPHCRVGAGWLQPQAWGSWATGAVSRVAVDVATAAPRGLLIKARANNALAEDLDQYISVSINGHVFDDRPVARRWTRLRYRIPRGVLKPGSNTIELRFSERISPSQAGVSKDQNTLAAGISQLILQAPNARSAEHFNDHQDLNVWDETRQAFLIEDPGNLVIPVLVPAGTKRIELDLHSPSGAESPTIPALVAVEDLDGVEHGRQETEIQSRKAPQTTRLPVEDLAGKWVLTTIETSVDTGRLEVSKPRFMARPQPEIDHDSGAETVQETPPDVILITLDAARADRFSYAGHPRLTTPFIDGLAQESLVFSDAYALVPYTLASVPTMITGLSFIDHGVVGHEDVLSQDAVTLAEIFSQSGYHTACFSATPNNSRAKGFDQGYEVFREVWTEGVGRKENRRARFMAKTVVEWLDTIKDDQRPLHLQVHMVPPHAPYDPSPRFDLFSDPTYDGPCDGFHKTLAAIDGGSLEAAPECIEHLLNLYDGNLRAADHAVERIVKALRKRPRWRNTVVLVTSDHGEAFWEHGQLGHNSTVYSEMLHVPFVLRMPEGFDDSGVDTGRLATLADIVPTMLGAAGLPVPQFQDSVNLLETDTDTGGRFFVSRTATAPQVNGIRSLRWSLMVNAAGSGVLFDISNDPEELRDTRYDHPMRYIGLGKIMSATIRRPAQLLASVATDDITDEERALLETLGYIVD